MPAFCSAPQRVREGYNIRASHCFASRLLFRAAFCIPCLVGQLPTGRTLTGATLTWRMPSSSAALSPALDPATDPSGQVLDHRVEVALCRAVVEPHTRGIFNARRVSIAE